MGKDATGSRDATPKSSRPGAYAIKEFKQCPFCGRIWMSVETLMDGLYTVRCLCGASGPKERSIDKAVSAWNIRDQHLLWNPFRLSIRFPDNTLTLDFKGNLEAIDLATILQMLSTREKTGILILTKGHNKSAICLKNGNIIAASDSSGTRIGQILMNKGVITRDNLREALKKAKRTGKLLGEVLLGMAFIDEKVLKEMVQKQVQEAVLELFFWREGTFEYRDCILEFDERAMSEINTMEIIIESARRLDEWDELKFRPRSGGGGLNLEAGDLLLQPEPEEPGE